jgi:hypothetical protein
MSELVAWLTQILDEDEAYASGIGRPDGHYPDPYDPGSPLHHQSLLADIAAKRAIIERYNEVRTRPAGPDAYVNGIGMARVESFEMVVETLASAYADRSGYREDWREAWER